MRNRVVKIRAFGDLKYGWVNLTRAATIHAAWRLGRVDQFFMGIGHPVAALAPPNKYREKYDRAPHAARINRSLLLRRIVGDGRVNFRVLPETLYFRPEAAAIHYNSISDSRNNRRIPGYSDGSALLVFRGDASGIAGQI